MSTPTPLEARLGYEFHDASLLVRALTHSSVTQEKGPATEHNQRLEFLGDAVLQLCLTHALYERHPRADEGVLSRNRAHLVNQQSLLEQARQLGLGESLILSRSEEANGGRQRASILADAYEAVLGAIYLDGGLEAARACILRHFQPGLLQMAELPSAANPKGALQEQLQADSSEPPEYVLLASRGPDHDRDFECAVRHRGRELGRGLGKSKKAAETAAATNALEQLRPKDFQPSAPPQFPV